MQVNVYIVENDVIRKWEDISPSEQKEISSALNRQCLTTLGYIEKVN